MINVRFFEILHFDTNTVYCEKIKVIRNITIYFHESRRCIMHIPNTPRSNHNMSNRKNGLLVKINQFSKKT